MKFRKKIPSITLLTTKGIGLGSYMILILRWVAVLTIGYGLYAYFIDTHGFQLVQFVTLIGVVLAFLKDIVLDFLLPPVFWIRTSDSKPHFHEFPTEISDVLESWLAVEVKNIGMSSARNVLVYFNGIKSNGLTGFDAFQSLPIRRTFGEVPQEKDPLPRPVLVPRCARFFFSFCYIQNRQPSCIRFKFARTPMALKEINCGNDARSYFEFEVLVASDTRFVINRRAKFKLVYDGIYQNGIGLNRM